MIASGIFLVGFLTSLFGRVWCGWACPQTVFIQTIFMKIETFFEGKARERREFDKAPWTFNKLLRRTLKWIFFLVISLHVSHTFIGYFVGPRELFQITMHNPSESRELFMITLIITAILLLDFGWFREQFCIIACPYGRMQSVMMDENSLVISYDAKRGGDPGRSKEGDCINCYKCVKVCPTGIDIRRGTQLECIACTQCIDACDEIMSKIKRPNGLIRYSSENEIMGKVRKRITLRSAIYASILILFVFFFFYFLQLSTSLNMVFLRSKIPYQVIESGQVVVNHFTLKLSHQGKKKFTIGFKVMDPKWGREIQAITHSHPTIVSVPDKKIVLFFKFPKRILVNGGLHINVSAVDFLTNEILSTKEVTLVGPNY